MMTYTQEKACRLSHLCQGNSPRQFYLGGSACCNHRHHL